MFDLNTLQILWFVLVGVLFSGFFFLEGFDFGVGMQFIGLAKSDEERDTLYRAIGPNWDANEVWLITAGGALFASFPFWYASLFSGFYLLLFITLIGLIYRGVSFEFRENMETSKNARVFERLISISSFVVPFMFGMIFSSLIKGMPLDAQGNISATFFDYVNPYSIVGGLLVSSASYVHGLNFSTIKTFGDLREAATHQLKIWYPILLVVEAIFAVLTYFYTDFFANKAVLTTIIFLLIVVATVGGWFIHLQGREKIAFIFSGLSIVLMVVLIFSGLFPRVMVDSNHVNDLLIANASSSKYTLNLMTWITISALPVTLLYQVWSFIVFARRIKTEEK